MQNINVDNCSNTGIWADGASGLIVDIFLNASISACKDLVVKFFLSVAIPYDKTTSVPCFNISE